MNTSLFTDKNMLQLDLEQLVRAKEVKEEQKKLLLQKMKQLTTLRIFNDMDDREIAEIMVRSDFVEYKDGDIVFEEGQKGSTRNVLSLSHSRCQ